MLQGLSQYFKTFRFWLQSSPSMPQEGNLLISIPFTTTNCLVNKKKFQVAETLPVSDNYHWQHKILLIEKEWKKNSFDEPNFSLMLL